MRANFSTVANRGATATVLCRIFCVPEPSTVARMTAELRIGGTATVGVVRCDHITADGECVDVSDQVERLEVAGWSGEKSADLCRAMFGPNFNLATEVTLTAGFAVVPMATVRKYLTLAEMGELDQFSTRDD